MPNFFYLLNAKQKLYHQELTLLFFMKEPAAADSWWLG